MMMDELYLTHDVDIALGWDHGTGRPSQATLSGEQLLAALQSGCRGGAVNAHVLLRGKAQAEAAVRQLPEGLRIHGSLVVVEARGASLAFPPRLAVEDCLVITELGDPADNEHGLAALTFGEGLQVGRHLEVHAPSQPLVLPEGLAVGGNLSLAYCVKLPALPESLQVGGSLSLAYCRSLKSLPASLTRIAGKLDLRKCQALTGVPEDLHVAGDLSLTDCAALTSLPASVRVLAGTLDLQGCAALEAQHAEDMHAFLTQVRATTGPEGGLRLAFWSTALRELPDCFATLGGMLDLSWCAALARLPDGLHVRGHLRLSECAALTRLPDRLRVGGSLTADRCTSLTSLPAGLWVGEDLNVRACTSLTTLPEDLHVGWNLQLEQCSSLESLPASLLEWPVRQEDAEPHRIYLAGSGLSAETLSWLRVTEPPGLSFYVDLHGRGLRFFAGDEASEARQDFASAQEAAAFWAREARKPVEIAAVPQEGHAAQTLVRFLSRLRDAKEFGILETREALAKRIVDVLKLLSGEDEHVREELLLRMADSLDACGDKPVWALNQMHLVVEVAKARESAEQLRDLGRRVMRLMVVHEHAKRKVDSLRWVDDVCVHLRFEIDLREALDLPVAATAMIFPSYINVTDAELKAAKDDALAITDAQFEAWLAEWPEWQRHQRHQVVAELRWQELAEIKRPRQSLRKRVSRRLSELVSVVGDKVVDPVTFDNGKSVWSLSDLLQHWERTGLDLHNSVVSPDELKSGLRRLVDVSA